MRWSGNTTTRCRVQASLIACKVPASIGRRRSTPLISAPSAGWRGLTVMVMLGDVRPPGRLRLEGLGDRCEDAAGAVVGVAAARRLDAAVGIGQHQVETE